MQDLLEKFENKKNLKSYLSGVIRKQKPKDG